MSRVLALVVAIAVGAACASAPDKDARVTLDGAVPDRKSFDPVGIYLDKRCGSLDCHGAVGRNLKLYGYYGLRLAPDDFAGGGDTSEFELDADYRSIVGLEPEIMTAVVRDGGARPDRLTLVRKARGTEDHKGGKLVDVGDAQDTCITSWLAGSTDQAACKSALDTP